MSTHTIYGNPQVAELLTYMKECNDGMMDGEEKKNRFACWRLMNKMRKLFPSHDTVDAIKRLIDHAKKDSFHGPNLTSFIYLDSHAAKIINRAKEGKRGGQQSTEQYAHASADALARKLADREG
jgi:hypothetical protein